ncbi:FecR family protein [Prevotella sp. 10(H)]|uniref:FecR family protein n=1 Tax=Prevotella sp. 10(H) TaxID=1158294 RepID=UPI0004A74C5E|nr:FecR family protein [Prevotella sp. 10(H)]
MTNKKIYTYRDFLNNDIFVQWRLTRTKELNEYWADFEEQNPECRQALEEAIDKFKSVILNNYHLSDIQANTLLTNIRRDIASRKKRSRRLYIFALSAACIAVLVATTLFGYLNNQDVLPEDSDLMSSISGETNNSENIQVISGGKSLAISQEVEIKLTDKGQASIKGVDGEEIENLDLSHKQLNKIIVPYGKRSSVVLADGTKVWLNSGTELEFPTAFDGKTRDINVKGEIYIDVAKDEAKPFYIHSSQFDIKVLGTKFNVSAYDDDAVNSIVLVEGRVSVTTPTNSVTMKPNEMLAINAGNIEKSIVDIQEYIGWKDGILNFRKATLADILNRVGRYYNISFNKSDHIAFAQKTYSGKLLLSDNLDDVMNSISAFSSTIYERNNNVILIKNKD